MRIPGLQSVSVSSREKSQPERNRLRGEIQCQKISPSFLKIVHSRINFIKDDQKEIINTIGTNHGNYYSHFD